MKNKLTPPHVVCERTNVHYYFTVSDASKIIHVHPSSLRKAFGKDKTRKTNLYPLSYKSGQIWLIHPKDLVAYAQSIGALFADPEYSSHPEEN